MRPLLRSLSWVFSRLPLSAAHTLGVFVALTAWCFSRRKQEMVERIQSCLDLEPPEARGLAKQSYRNLGYTLAEFMRMPLMTESDVRELLRYEHTDRLPKSGEGYLILVAHTGNWELTAAASPLLGYQKLHLVVKALKPESLNQWINGVREQWGNTVHDRKDPARDLMKAVKSNEPLIYVLDQNSKRNQGVFVDFFGHPACTSDGLAKIAALSGLPIIPVFCRREPDSRKLVAEVGEAVPGPKNRSPEEVLRVTSEATARIEAFIRAYPDQWIWMHRRWRTQPEPEGAA